MDGKLRRLPRNLDTDELFRSGKLYLDDEIVCEPHVQRVGGHDQGDEGGGERTLDFAQLKYWGGGGL